MLKNLVIDNVALIDNLSIDFEDHFNVLTGETGAGKSIIIDALSFVLGARSSKTLIKQNESVMKVTALFLPPFSNDVNKLLKEYDLDTDDGLIITRKLSIDGKSDIRINGTPFTLAMLKPLTQLLVDIHGQHEHQKLLQNKYHLSIIDSFIKDKTIFSQYSSVYDELQRCNEDIASLNSSPENQERMLDLLNYQINEIESANLQIDEDVKLESQLQIMQNAEKIFESIDGAISNLDNPILIDGIKHSSSLLSNIEKYDESISSLIERVDNIKYDLQDISTTLKEKKEGCNYDKYEIDSIHERLDIIKTLKRKYGASIEEIFQFLEKAKEQYDNIQNSKTLLKNKLQEKEKILDNLFSLACQISDIRRNVARDFEEKTKYELGFLGMKNAEFHVEFSPYLIRNDCERYLTHNGGDSVTFMFSANLGQNMKPLSEIISGGEASRFMLALKNILSSQDSIDMMVFDEIDTGISGEMGYKVACKLASISRKHQVLSVSHLPQICAMADNNILINKYVENKDTRVSASSLDERQILGEIARLSGGDKDNEASLEHASILRKKCEEYKSSLIS